MTIEMGDSKQSIEDTEIDQPAIDDAEIDDNEVEAAAEHSENTTVVLDETGVLTDNVGDVSVEINVEELIADIESVKDKDAARKKEIRRRLEEVVEEQSFEDTYAVDLDEK
ncbi:MAG: hypothetical protein O7D92_10350 [Proteobacteria bacterium]|nr:hypothetical protein [Pseudomonadota bacterium]